MNVGEQLYIIVDNVPLNFSMVYDLVDRIWSLLLLIFLFIYLLVLFLVDVSSDITPHRNISNVVDYCLKSCPLRIVQRY